MITIHTPDQTSKPIRRGDILIAPPTTEGPKISLWRAKGRGWSNASQEFLTYPGEPDTIYRIMGLPGRLFRRAMGFNVNSADYAEANKNTRGLRMSYWAGDAAYLMIRVVHRLNAWEAMNVPEDAPEEMLNMLLGDSSDINNTAELFQHVVMQCTVSALRTPMHLKAYTAEEQIRLDIQGEP